MKSKKPVKEATFLFNSQVFLFFSRLSTPPSLSFLAIYPYLFLSFSIGFTQRCSEFFFFFTSLKKSKNVSESKKKNRQSYLCHHHLLRLLLSHPPASSHSTFSFFFPTTLRLQKEREKATRPGHQGQKT